MNAAAKYGFWQAKLGGNLRGDSAIIALRPRPWHAVCEAAIVHFAILASETQPTSADW